MSVYPIIGSPLVIHEIRSSPASLASVPGAVKVTVDSVRDSSVASTPTLDSSVMTSLTLSSGIGEGKMQVNCIDTVEMRRVYKEK